MRPDKWAEKLPASASQKPFRWACFPLLPRARDGQGSTGSPHCDKKMIVGQTSSVSWQILEEGSGTFLDRRTEVILLHLSFLRVKKQEQTAALPVRDGSHRRLGCRAAPSSRCSSLWYWKKLPVWLTRMPASCIPIIACCSMEKLQGEDIGTTRRMQII